MFQEFVNIRNYQILDEKNKIVFNPKHMIKIKIVIIMDEKLDMSFFYSTYAIMDEDIKHLIFICRTATIQMKKLRVYKDVLRIELFYENELKRLITGNRLIPKHILLSHEKQQEVIKRFGRENLPLILNTDPIVKLYDFDVNSVIMIERKNGIYYRLVVNDE